MKYKIAHRTGPMNCTLREVEVDIEPLTLLIGDIDGFYDLHALSEGVFGDDFIVYGKYTRRYPEDGFHFRSFSKVFDMLTKLVKDTSPLSSLICPTYSPFLLDEFFDEERRRQTGEVAYKKNCAVLVATIYNGEIVIGNLDLEKFYREFAYILTLGEAWMNLSEAVFLGLTTQEKC
ncbi:MAG: hypothetical protein Q8O94_03075 [bacterium]|nr:hypothetical protein [bacterium]